ncbi:hypothetical protein HDV00_004753 [Rhizophlyctis rosea]|nr:hypothetical protein HDV00_004753 [Rhizophlyctis rosea]
MKPTEKTDNAPQVSLSTRILLGFASCAIAFIIAAAMAASTGMAPYPYFYATIFLVGVSGVSSAFLSGVLGVAASYPPLFTTAISSGQGFAGLVPALVQFNLVLSTTPTNDTPTTPRNAVMALYFSVNIFISVLAILGFLAIPHLKLHHAGYESVASSESLVNGDADVVFDDGVEGGPQIATLKEVWPYVTVHAICVMVNFLITLSVFPGITSSVLPVGGGGDQRREQIFLTLHFFCFNLGDWTGRSILALSPHLLPTPSSLPLHTLLRTTLLPLLLLCNITLTTPTGTPIPRLLPLLFTDIPYFLILFVFAFSNGWLGTSVLMLAPRSVDGVVGLRGKEGVGRVVGDVMVVGLSLGLVVGGVGSFLVRGVLCGCNPFVG